MKPTGVADESDRPSKTGFWVGLALTIGVFILSRIPYLLKAPELIGSDNAIVGLMARHIAQGLHFPVYYYGQGYMGAGEAYVAALFFLLFGESAFVFSLSSLFLFVVFLVLWAILVRRAAGGVAALTGIALIVVLPQRMSELFMFSLGGYILVLMLGVAFQLSWLMNLYTKAGTGAVGSARWVMLVAVVAGGFGTNPVFLFFVLPYLLMALLEILVAGRQTWNASLRTGDPQFFERVGVLLGAAGILLVIVSIFVRVSGIELNLGRLFSEPVTLTSEKAWRHLFRGLILCALAGVLALWGRTGWKGLRAVLARAQTSFYLLGGITAGFSAARVVHILSAYNPAYSFGHVEHPLRLLPLQAVAERPVWIWNDFVPYALGVSLGWGSAISQILFSLFLIACAWMAWETFRRAWGKIRQSAWTQSDMITLSFWLSPATFLLALVFSSAAQDRLAGRYLAFLVAWWPFALLWFGRRMWSMTRIGGAALALLLAITLGGNTINRLGNTAAWATSPPMGPFGDVIEKLERENVHHAYADYWVAYVVSFLAKESLIVTPGPEYTFSHTRYPHYATRVAEAERKAYLFRRDIDEVPRKVVRQALLSKGHAFNDIAVGNWRIILDE